MGRIVQFCTFEVGADLFGILVDEAKEVIRLDEVTPVPLAPDHVRGLVNLRGRILTVIDLERRLAVAGGPSAGGLASAQHGLVLDVETGGLCLAVDRVGDVVEVDDDAFEAPPETMPEALRTMLLGAYKIGTERLLLVLDTERVIAPTPAA